MVGGPCLVQLDVLLESGSYGIYVTLDVGQHLLRDGLCVSQESCHVASHHLLQAGLHQPAPTAFSLKALVEEKCGGHWRSELHAS